MQITTKHENAQRVSFPLVGTEYIMVGPKTAKPIVIVKSCEVYVNAPSHSYTPFHDIM